MRDWHEVNHRIRGLDMVSYIIVASFLCGVLGELSCKILEIRVNNSATLYIDAF